MKRFARNITTAPVGRAVLFFMLALLSFHRPVEAVPKFIPVLNGQFSTGQWYFDQKQSSLSGNAAILFIPAIRYTNRFSLIPSIDSTYRGTRSSEELAGGNIFFQDTWENGVGIKSVHGLNKDWKWKNRAAYRFKWFRETTNETWNNGLYDYRTITIGTELERTFSNKTSVALSYDFSYLQFPNYQSLESTRPSDQSREFSGGSVMDNRIHVVSLKAASSLMWGSNGTAQLFISPRQFIDQHVVVASGLLSPTLRKDQYIGGTLNVERAFNTSQTTRLIPNVYVGYSELNSNQNHYDAQQTTFIGNYYDYDQRRIGTQITYLVGMRNNLTMSFNVGGSYSHRQYHDRPIQAVDASYQSELLNINESTIELGYSYPLSKSFRLQMTSSLGKSKSNNNYEAVYRYNYTNSNYQFGFTYDY